MVVRVVKTFEMVHLPEWLRPSARLARQKVLAPWAAFFSLLRPPTFLLQHRPPRSTIASSNILTQLATPKLAQKEPTLF
jgi:hypothetical protein